MEQPWNTPSHTTQKRLECLLGTSLSLLSIFVLQDEDLREISVLAVITLLLGVGIVGNTLYNKEE
jgi:hypothetical protein